MADIQSDLEKIKQVLRDHGMWPSDTPAAVETVVPIEPTSDETEGE